MDIVEHWIIAAAFVAGTAAIGYFAGRIAAAFRRVSPAGPSGAGAFRPDIVVDCRGGLSLSERARDWLAVRRTSYAAISDLTAEGAFCSGGLADAITRLAADGSRVDAIIETQAGRFFEAAGEMDGLVARFQLTDCTRFERRAAAAERKLARMGSEAARLRDVLRAVGVAAWWRGEAGSAAWLELSQSGLSRDVQAALIDGAASASPRRVQAPTPDAAPNDEAAAPGRQYLVSRLDGDAPVVVARNISEVTELEQLMNRLVLTMSETFAHLSVGLMIFDDRNRLTLFNPAVLTLFDEDRQWLATRPSLGQILERWRRDGKLPERLDHAAWKRRFEQPPDTDDPAGLEERWHLGDGRSLRVLRRSHPSSGIALVIEDITEAISLRRSSVSERAVRSATTDLLNDGLVVIGPEGRIRMMNRAFRNMWGIDDAAGEIATASELEAHCAPRTNAPEFWSRIRLVATAAADRDRVDRRLSLADSRVMQPRLSPMPDGSTLIVFTDVTASEAIADALRIRNEALEHADEMRSALVDQISHRMRTPLNSIYGFGQILADKRFGPLNEDQTEQAEAIVSSAGELVEVVNEMSDLIAMGGDVGGEDAEAFAPSEVLGDVLRLVRRRFREARLRVSDRSAASGEVFLGQRSRVRQVMFNLLTDALSQSGGRGEVRVELELSGGEIDLFVRHVADRPATDRGLALSLAHRSIALCGGKLSIAAGDGRRDLRAVIPDEATATLRFSSPAPVRADAC